MGRIVEVLCLQQELKMTGWDRTSPQMKYGLHGFENRKALYHRGYRQTQRIVFGM
jgi:hypothetical protein